MPDLTKTRIQLVNEAASKLQVVGSGQSLEAEDGETIDAKVDDLLLQLATDEIVSVTNTDEIPAAWFDAIASLLANICADDFGKAYDPGKVTFYEAKLRRLASARPTYETLQTTYF